MLSIWSEVGQCLLHSGIVSNGRNIVVCPQCLVPRGSSSMGTPYLRNVAAEASPDLPRPQAASLSAQQEIGTEARLSDFPDISLLNESESGESTDWITICEIEGDLVSENADLEVPDTLTVDVAETKAQSPDTEGTVASVLGKQKTLTDAPLISMRCMSQKNILYEPPFWDQPLASTVEGKQFPDEFMNSDTSTKQKTSEEPVEAKPWSPKASEVGNILEPQKEREYSGQKLQALQLSDRPRNKVCGKYEDTYTQRVAVSKAKVNAWLVGNDRGHYQSDNIENEANFGNKDDGSGKSPDDVVKFRKTMKKPVISCVEDKSPMLTPSTPPSDWQKGSASQMQQMVEERGQRGAIAGGPASASDCIPPPKSSVAAPQTSAAAFRTSAAARRTSAAARRTSAAQPQKPYISTDSRAESKNTSERSQRKQLSQRLYVPPHGREIQQENAAAALQSGQPAGGRSRRNRRARMRRASQPVSVNSRVQEIYFMGKKIHLIDFDNHPYVSTEEIITKFTKLNGIHLATKVLDVRNAAVPFCDVSRELRPDLFEHLDRSQIWKDQRSANRDSLHMLPLKSVPHMLYMLLIDGEFDRAVKGEVRHLLLFTMDRNYHLKFHFQKPTCPFQSVEIS